jgi:putative membrane protein
MAWTAEIEDRSVAAAFLAECGIVACGLAVYLATGMNAATRLLTSLAGLASVAFVICHGRRMLGGRRATAFLLLAAATGFCAEWICVQGCSLFGEAYHYPEERWKGIGSGVPLAAPVFWAVFIYGGHAIVNAFLAFAGPTGAAAHRPLRQTLASVPLLAAADACVVTSIDLFMDPITTLRGQWVWAEAGTYFGVPVGNFVGWFAVSFTVCAAFRAYGCFRPGPQRPCPGWVHLVPGLSYLSLAAIFTVYACSLRRYDIVLAGLSATGPISVLLLVCYFASKQKATGPGQPLFSAPQSAMPPGQGI